MATARLELIADSRQVRRATDDLRQLENRGQTTTSVIGGLRSAFVALAGAAVIGKAIKTTADFNQAIADLSAITGAAGEDLRFYREEAAQIGRTTSLSASQAATAFKLIASAKPDLLESADALNAVTREAVTLAEATGIELPAAASALGSALNQFQLDASRSNEVINLLAASSKLGAAEVSSVTEALRNSGAAAQSLGIDLAETVAGIQALAASGRQGSDAGTALRQVLLRLEATGNQKLQPSVVGLVGALNELKSQSLDNTQLMDLFGQEAFTAATSLLAQSETAERLNTTLRGTNTATEQAATRMDTLTGDTLALRSAFEGLQIAVLGDEFDGLSRSVVQLSTDAINGLTENLDTLATIGTTIAAIYGARVVGAFAASTAAKVSDVAATVAQTQATASAAAAEANYLRVVQASLVAQLRSSTVATQQIAIRKQLALNTNALTAAQLRANTAITAGGVAARGASAAFALLGGPTGAVLAAGFALFKLTESYREGLAAQDDRIERIMREYREQQALNKEMERAGKLFSDTAQSTAAGATAMDNYRDSLRSAYQEQVQGLGQSDLQAEFDSVSESLEKAEARLARVGERFAEGTLRYRQAEQAVIEYREKIEVLNGIVPTLTTSQEQASEALGKVTQSLEDQIFRLREGEQAYELLTSARQAGVDIDSEEGQGLRALIEERAALTEQINAEAEARRNAARAEQEANQLGDQARSLGFEMDLEQGGQEARIDDEYFERLSIIDNALAAERLSKEEHRQLELQAEESYQQKLTEFYDSEQQQRLSLLEQEARQRQALFESQVSGLGEVFGNFANIAKEGGEESFGTYKALASAQAAMSAAVAISRALAEGGPFLGPTLAVSIGALTGAQIARINKQEYNPRANGGQTLGGNNYLVGERGPEVISTQGNGRVTPFNQLMNAAGGGGGQAPIYLNVSIDEKASEDNVSQRVTEDRRIIDVVVANGYKRGRIHKMIRETTTANSRTGG